MLDAAALKGAVVRSDQIPVKLAGNEVPRADNTKAEIDVYMQAVGPQKRMAQNNLVKLVRKGAVSESKSA